ncbi:hypothetical protein [Halovulum sp. GXIMD14793]
MGHMITATKATLKLAAIAAVATSLSGCLMSVGGSENIGDNVRVGTSVSHDFETGRTRGGLSTGVTVHN